MGGEVGERRMGAEQLPGGLLTLAAVAAQGRAAVQPEVLELAVDLVHARLDVLRQSGEVPEHGQPSARPQHVCGLVGAGLGSHPVPGLSAREQGEAPPPAVPLLEGRHLDREALGPRDLRHARVGLGPEDPGAALVQQR